MQIRPVAGFHEPFSSWTHLLGALVFLGLGLKLLLRARGDGPRMAFYSAYVFGSVFLLSMSGVYHLLREGSGARAVLGQLDHAAIFALIAGTHTPIQGLFFRGPARWAPLAAMWTAVATGVTLFTVYYGQLPTGLTTGIFLLLGWIAAISGLIVWRRLGTSNVVLLVGGGVAYSVGAISMALDWPTLFPGVIGAHELWHVAVLVAMVLHWRFLYRFARFPTSGPLPFAT